MMTVLLLGFLTGLDNFFVSSGFGALRLKRLQMITLITGFALCEATMPVVGYYLVNASQIGAVEWIGPVLLITAALIVGYRVLHGGSNPSLGYGLVLAPVALSLDNLAAGAGLGAVGGFDLSSVLLAGILAAVISLAGFATGRVLSTALKFNPHVALAVCLLAIGAIELVETL